MPEKRFISCDATMKGTAIDRKTHKVYYSDNTKCMSATIHFSRLYRGRLTQMLRRQPLSDPVGGQAWSLTNTSPYTFRSLNT